MIQEVRFGLMLLTGVASVFDVLTALATHGAVLPVLLLAVCSWCCGYWMHSLAKELAQ